MNALRERPLTLCLAVLLIVGNSAEAKRKDGAGGGPKDGGGGEATIPILSFAADRAEYRNWLGE